MQIIRASKKDMNELVALYHIAVEHMFEEKNVNQWQHDETNFVNHVNKYIDDNNFYKVEKNNEIIGFFAMIYGTDVTYNEIKGKWINDEPYVTIHKIASKYYKQGIATKMLNYVLNDALEKSINNIRIDTHKDNVSMQKFLEKQGFVNCGVISITCDFNNLSSHRNAFIKEIKTSHK